MQPRSTPAPVNQRTAPRLQLERLEDRTVPSTNPFDSSYFQQQMTDLLAQYQVPEASLSLLRGGELFTWTSSGTSSPTPDSVFRIGSISKSFAAAVTMNLVEDGHLGLDDPALAVLGYTPGQVISGDDPTQPGTTVGAALPPALFQITVRDLLSMSSGLPLEVPVTSTTFPGAGKSQVLYLQGSYAALAFAGGPPYAAPADVNQQINYYLYQVSAAFAANPVVYRGPDAVARQAAGDFVLLSPGRYYVYSDIGYAILGAITQSVITANYGIDYADYLQQYILDPMRIAPPTQPGQPVTNQAMVGLGHTLASQAYGTEVTYASYPDEPPQPNIFPNSTATTPPFYPTDPNRDAIRVAQPYGGDFFLESHFAEGGLVATPTALVRFFENLAGTLDGTVNDGPLTRGSVREMVKPPDGRLRDDLGPRAFFGLGIQVYPQTKTYNGGLAWFKNGDLPGNSAALYRYHDGTIWSAAFNIDVYGQGDTTQADDDENTFALQFRDLVEGAVYGPRVLTGLAGAAWTTRTGAAFPGRFRVSVVDVAGEPVYNVPVVFAAPASGPSGSFAGGATTAMVYTNRKGRAVAPRFFANNIAGNFVLSTQATLTFTDTGHTFSYQFTSNTIEFDLTSTPS